MGSGPGPQERQGEIDARLAAARARLGELRERNLDSINRATTPERLEAAHRHAAQAQAAAISALTSSLEAFIRAAEAHQRVASVHDGMAASGIGDVLIHGQQAALHRTAAQADQKRAEDTQSLLAELDGAGLTVDNG